MSAVGASPPRSDPAQRKRPKYTRSKSGCLTCRVKKIKCDEAKPVCSRCSHGQRECTWPEGVSTRKKSSPKYSPDGRPLTANSSDHVSASSSPPPTREHSPRTMRALNAPMTDTDTRYSHLHSSSRRAATISSNPLSRPMHPEMMSQVLGSYPSTTPSANHVSFPPRLENAYTSGVLPAIDTGGYISRSSHHMPMVTSPVDAHQMRSYVHSSPPGMTNVNSWSAHAPPLHHQHDPISVFFRTPKERSLVRSAHNTM